MADEILNVLSLLALKVKQNVFDISSGQYNVSIRDQIARGHILARDLIKADPNVESILIIGAGVVGVAAAERALIESEMLNKKTQITIIEQFDKPFHLQRGVHTRYVGPFMYEWPAASHPDQSYPPANEEVWGSDWPTKLTWSSANPITADTLCTYLDKWIDELQKSYPKRLTIHYGIFGDKAINQVKNFVSYAKNAYEDYEQGKTPVNPYSFKVEMEGAAPFEVQANYVLLACGPGEEKVNIFDDIGGDRFWKDDTLCEGSTNTKRTAVLGGGDGALQDVLRALTGKNHPLDILDAMFFGEDSVRSELETEYGALITAEHQARLLQNWTTDPMVDKRLDEACGRVAERLARSTKVRTKVAACIRDADPAYPDACITHVTKSKGFDRAYMLNRFLVHLIKESQKHSTWPSDRLKYIHLSETEVSGACKGADGIVQLRLVPSKSEEASQSFDQVIVRFGVVEGTTATGEGMKGKFVQLTKRESDERTSFGKIQLPFLVP